MTDFEKVLMKRDGMSREEAHDALMNVRNDISMASMILKTLRMCL